MCFVWVCLEEIRRSDDIIPRSHRSGSFVVVPSSSPGASPSVSPVTDIISSLPTSDLLVLTSTGRTLPSLPVSPYPAPVGTPILAHFVSTSPPLQSSPGVSAAEWKPWVGGLWGAWVRGIIRGYRDFAGINAKPDCSSGGPILDENTGAVVGVVRGTRMDSRVEGVRGWGVPAERIFEMFRLPGLHLNNPD